MNSIRFVKDLGWDEEYPGEEWIKPRRSTKNSAGYDFFAPKDIVVPAGGECLIRTYTKAMMGENVVLLMVPRSGLGFKYGIALSNTVGVIDSDYYSDEPGKGCIAVKLHNPSKTDVVIEKGKAYCQGIFMSFLCTDDDEAFGTRNGNGFGSTDKNN